MDDGLVSAIYRRVWNQIDVDESMASSERGADGLLSAIYMLKKLHGNGTTEREYH